MGQPSKSRKGNGAVKLIGRDFLNKKTEMIERHYFESADTLKVFVASFCMPWGDYCYLEGVKI